MGVPLTSIPRRKSECRSALHRQLVQIEEVSDSRFELRFGNSNAECFFIDTDLGAPGVPDTFDAVLWRMDFEAVRPPVAAYHKYGRISKCEQQSTSPTRFIAS